MNLDRLLPPTGPAARSRLARRALGALLVSLLALGAGATAAAEEPETWRVIGTLMAYDPASQTLAVREPSTPRVYRIRRSGPLATEVSWNARPARLDEIPRGARVALRWRRDPSGGRVVRLIEGPWAPDPAPISN